MTRWYMALSIFVYAVTLAWLIDMVMLYRDYRRNINEHSGNIDRDRGSYCGDSRKAKNETKKEVIKWLGRKAQKTNLRIRTQNWTRCGGYLKMPVYLSRLTAAALLDHRRLLVLMLRNRQYRKAAALISCILKQAKAAAMDRDRINTG